MQRKKFFRNFKKKKSNCSFYVGKRVMALSVELVVTPTAKIADNLLKNINEVVDEYFAKTKILREIG